MDKFIEKWYRENAHKFYIEAKSGTFVHLFAYLIHFVAKFTALFPSFRRRIKAKRGHLDTQLRAALEHKYNLYKENIKKHQDNYGFIDHKYCDSILWSGLLSITGIEVQLEKARGKDGFWQRRPTENPCYPTGSASSFSRDMLTGLVWYLWDQKDRNLAESTYKHMKKHCFVMGRGDPARLIMMPSLEATLAEICYRLGGKNRRFTRRQMQHWPKGLRGYPVHLSVMHILLRGRIFGNIDSKMYDSLKHYAKTHPNNPVYNFAYKLYNDGNMNEVAKLLMNEEWWPNDRLPRRRDRRSSWITQRDYGDDWLPARDDDLDQEHHGGDFLVATKLLLESLN